VRDETQRSVKDEQLSQLVVVTGRLHTQTTLQISTNCNHLLYRRQRKTLVRLTYYYCHILISLFLSRLSHDLLLPWCTEYRTHYTILKLII